MMGLQTAEGAKQHEKTLSISPSGSYSKVRHQHHVRPLKAAHWRDICRFHILAKCLADEIILFDKQGRQSAKALENAEAMGICLKFPILDSLPHQTPPQPVDKKTLSGIDEKALYLAMTRVEKNSAQAHKLDTEATLHTLPKLQLAHSRQSVPGNQRFLHTKSSAQDGVRNPNQISSFGRVPRPETE